MSNASVKTPVPAGFVAPNWNGAPDLSAYLAEAPTDGTSKGFNFTTAMAAAGVRPTDVGARDRYVSFKDYPLPEYLRVLYSCAERVDGAGSVRQALRIMARPVYARFADSMVGRVIFAAVGRDPGLALKLTPKVYGIVGSPGSCRLVNLEPGCGMVELRNVWSFGEAYHVGIFEGAGAALGTPATVHIRSHSLCDFDLWVSWKDT